MSHDPNDTAMKTALITTTPPRPRLMSPPMISPGPDLKPYRVTASDGRSYRVTPNGKRTYQPDLSKPAVAICTFKYQRIDAAGNLIKRLRMSKKNKLRLRRAVAQAA